MTKLLKGAAVAALIAGAAMPAFAQTVLTVDLDRIYAESAAGKSAVAQLQTRFQAPGQQVNAAITSARTAYETQLQAAQKLAGPTGDASKLPPATRQALEDAQNRFDEARSQGAQLTQAVQASQGYVRDQINQAVLPIVEQVRAERKASIVAVKGGLLASDPAADVTSVVLPRLDARLTTVAIVPPQAAVPAAGAAPAAAAPAATGRRNTSGR